MNSKILNILFLFILLWIVSTTNIFGQEVTPLEDLDYTIEEFILPGGRLGNNVNDIVQGPNGFVWFGSHGGLHRYDGNEIITYKNTEGEKKNETSSLTFPYVESLLWDSNSMLWVCTWGNGVYLFDPDKETFKHYPSIENDPTTLSHPKATCVAEDANGTIWVGTEVGLNRFDKTSQTFKRYFHKSNDSTSINSNLISSLYVDRQGTLWLGTGFAYFVPDGGSLTRYNPDDDSFTNYREEINNTNSLWSSSVRGIYEDSKGNFWVGTTKALHKMDRSKGTFERMMPNENAPFSPGMGQRDDPAVYSIIEDNDNALWVGNIMEEKFPTHLIRHDLNTKQNQLFPFKTSAWHLSLSIDETIWIAGAGISGKVHKISPKPKSYETTLKTKERYGDAFWKSSIHEKMNSMGTLDFPIGDPNDLIYDESRNVLWVLFNTGLSVSSNNYRILAGYYYDSQEFEFHLLPLVPPKTTFEAEPSFTFTAGMGVDPQGKIWSSADHPLVGVYSYDPATKKVEHFKHSPSDSTTISSNEISRVMVDSRGDVWVATHRKGLNRINSKTGKVKRYNFFNTPDWESQEQNSPIGLTEDSKGNIWIGGSIYEIDTRPTIIKLNPNTDSISTIILPPAFNFEVINNIAVSPITNEIAFSFEDKGLGMYHPQTGSFSFYSGAKNNFPFQIVANIFCDEFGYFWVASGGDNLFVKFKDPNDLTVITSRTGSGRWAKIGDLGENGKVYFLANEGPDEFDTKSDEYIQEIKKLPIQLTDLFVFGNRVVPSENSILKSPIWKTNTVELPHRVESFAISFNDFDFANPSKKYQYRLFPYEQSWVTTSISKANFYRVPSGSYEFQVKNNQGSVSTTKVIVLKPWWQSGWAYLLYGLSFIGVMYLVHRYQKTRTIRIEREKSKDRELAQSKEIEKAYHQLKSTQAQLIHAEKMASLGELTAGIAHEIQNPLNFVNNFSKVSNELLEEMEEEIQDGKTEEIVEIMGLLSQNLEKINHHGERASSIVKGMLQHSRTNSGVKEPTDINAICDEYLRLAYHGVRAKDRTFNADLKTEFDKNIGNVNIVPQDIGRVILNLISNAFYAVNKRKQKEGNDFIPLVKVSTSKERNHIVIKIEDNGNGIPKENLGKVFQPFFTTKPTGQGTGLGLSLSYDIIKGHGGEISVVSEEGKGTTFQVSLPTG